MGCALCYWDFLLSVLHPAACCGVGCGVMGWGVARAAAGAPASAEAAVKERLRAALLFFGRPQGVQFGLIQKEVRSRVSEA